MNCVAVGSALEGAEADAAAVVAVPFTAPAVAAAAMVAALLLIHW